MCECEQGNGRIIFNGDLQLIKRDLDAPWKITNSEQISPKGETKVVIKNPKGLKVLVHVTFQGNTQNQVVVRSNFQDIPSFSNVASHNGQFVPFSLTLNEVTDETNIVVDFKALNQWNNGIIANGSVTGYIRQIGL